MGLQKKKEMELGPSQHWGPGFRAGSGRTSAQAEKDMFTASPWTHLWLRLYSCGVWGWEDTSVCEKESVPGKTNKQPLGDGRFRCCWTIPSARHCFCLGLPARAPAWHPTMARGEHFVLSSAVRQGKARPSRWHVCTPKACMFDVSGGHSIAWSSHLLRPRTGSGDLEQKLSLPSFRVSHCSLTARPRLLSAGPGQEPCCESTETPEGGDSRR